MENKKNNQKTIIIVSNCTWYLYNFRQELLRDLNKKGYDLILISPLDEYYLNISRLFTKKEKHRKRQENNRKQIEDKRKQSKTNQKNKSEILNAFYNYPRLMNIGNEVEKIHTHLNL